MSALRPVIFVASLSLLAGGLAACDSGGEAKGKQTSPAARKKKNKEPPNTALVRELQAQGLYPEGDYVASRRYKLIAEDVDLRERERVFAVKRVLMLGLRSLKFEMYPTSPKMIVQTPAMDPRLEVAVDRLFQPRGGFCIRRVDEEGARAAFAGLEGEALAGKLVDAEGRVTLEGVSSKDAVTDNVEVAEGRMIAFARRGGDLAEWDAYYLHEECALGATLVKDVEVREDEIPGVEITLKKPGREDFAALSKESVGARLAMTIGDEVLAAPVVQEPITDGEILVTVAAGERLTQLLDAYTWGALIKWPPVEGVETKFVEAKMLTPDKEAPEAK